MFHSNNGYLEKHAVFDGIDADTVKGLSTGNTKTVVAFVNVPSTLDLSDVTTYTDLQSKSIDLDSQNGDVIATAGLFMSGKTSDPITLIAGQLNMVTIPVTRRVAKVVLKSLKVSPDAGSLLSDFSLHYVSSIGGNTYGNLGTFDLGANGYTQAMRLVLDNNFLPTSSYPFQTGGFFFTSTASAALYNATSVAGVANFKRLLSGIDVLIMAYEINPSVPVAQMLLEEWLKEYPHRVLWVMRDDNITNTNILNITAAEGEGTWQNIGTAYDATAGFRLAGPGDYAFDNRSEVQDFYNGPFGSVDTLGVYVAGDGVSGACKIDSLAKQYVTPLVYSNKASYKDYMSLGINKQRGIVYMGEAQFFMVNLGMSPQANTNGSISTTPVNGKYFYDVLNANIWTWITGRVIYGPAQ